MNAREIWSKWRAHALTLLVALIGMLGVHRYAPRPEPKEGTYLPTPTAGGLGGFAQGKAYVNRIPQDNFTTLLEPTVGFQPVAAGTNNLDCESLGVWETANVGTFWNIQYPSFDAGAQTAFGQSLVSCAVQPNGQCVNPDGGLAVINSNVELGASLADAGCTWSFDAGPLPGLSSLCFGCSAGVSTQIAANISGNLAAQSWDSGAPTVITITPNNVSPTVSAATLEDVQVPWGTALGATAITIGPANAPIATLSSVPAANGGHIFGTLCASPPCTLPIGVYAVNITSTFSPSVLSLPAAFTVAAAPAPILTALTTPLFMPANSGSAPAVPFQCTQGCTAITSCTVCGVTASVTGLTSSNVSIIPPTLTSFGTDQAAGSGGFHLCPVTCTNPGGTDSTHITGSGVNGVYVLESNIKESWRATQGITASTGAWTDLVTGVTAAIFGSTTKPTYTASCLNSQPCMQFNGTTNGLQTPTSFTQAQPDSIFYLGGNTAGTGAYFDSADTAARQRSALGVSGFIPTMFAGSSWNGTACCNTAVNYHWQEVVYNNASSAMFVDNVANGTGTAGTQSLHGLSIGIDFDGTTTPITGPMMVVDVYNGTPSSTSRTNLHTIATNIWAVP